MEQLSEGALPQPDYRCLALPSFDWRLTPAQQTLLKKVLTHTSYNYDVLFNKDCYRGSCLAIVHMIVMAVAHWQVPLTAFAIGATAHDAYYHERMLSKNALAVIWMITLLPPAALYVAWHCCDRETQANRKYDQYLQEGLELGLDSFASWKLKSLIRFGFKGQALCTGACNACTLQRKECVQCIERGVHTTCKNCWKTCSRCTACRKMRDTERCDYLMRQLGSSTDRSTINFDGLERYCVDLGYRRAVQSRDIEGCSAYSIN